MRPTVRHVVNSFIEAAQQRPEDFWIGEHRIVDRKSGMEFWIANGLPHYGVCAPFELRFGLIHGWRFADMVRQLKVYQAIQSLSVAEQTNA